MIKQLLTCQCSSHEHIAILTEDDEDTYLHIHLTKLSFLRRLKYGAMYIFGYQCRYGAFEEIILDNRSIQILKNLKDRND